MTKINLGAWDFNQYSMSGGKKAAGTKRYGQADFEKLKSMGATDAQLSLLGGVANQKGIKIGQWVSNNLPAANPWPYAKYGNWDMGMKDINMAQAQGKSTGDIRGYIQHAMDNDINVGSKAQDWFKNNQPATPAATPATIPATTPAATPATTPATTPAATPTTTPLPIPGTQTGQANVGTGYNALGIMSAGSTANTGGTSKTFGRNKRKWQDIQSQVSQGTLKNMTW